MASLGAFGGLGGIGGGTLGEVLVKVGIDTKQLDAGLAKAKAESETAGTTFGKFGQLAQAGFAIAGIAAVKFAADAIKSADDHEQALLLLQQAVGGTTAAYEAQANALQDLTGFQDEEILRADTTLARFKLTQEEISRTIPLILDWARATGESASTASAALGRALLGNTRGLKSLGIQFTATGNHAADLDTILKQLESRVGGTAEAFGQSFAGKLAILSAKLDDLKETIGAALIPIMEKLAAVGSKVLEIVGPVLAQSFKDAAQTATELGSALEPLLEVLNSIPTSTNQAGESTNAFADRWRDLQSANPIHILSDYNDWVLKTIGVTKEVAIQSATFQGNLEALTHAHRDAAEAAKANTEALQAEREAMKELAGKATTLIGSVLNLKDAQRELHKAQQDSTVSAAELHDKEVSVLEAFLGVKSNLSDLIEKMKDGKATSQDVIEKFDAMATKAGLSKGAINDLNGILQQYIDKINAIPRSVTTQLILTGDTVSDTGVGGNGGNVGRNRGGNGNGRGGSQDLRVFIDGQELTDAVHSRLIQKQRRSGSLQLT